jgi:hypothetical protein
MNHVAAINGLEVGKDVRLQSIGNADAYNKFISNNLNKTEYGVVFCLDKFDYFNTSVPCTVNYLDSKLHIYNILYNFTNSPNGFLTSAAEPYPKDAALTKLKTDIDNGYLDYYAKKNNIPSPKINLAYSDYPSTTNRFMQGADIVSSAGAFYFFFPPMITFVLVLMEIVREKDLKLRKSLLIIGLDNSAFWVSWFITSAFYAALVSLILVLTGKICGFDFFNNCSFLITFFLFFLYNLSMQFLAYFMTTILKSTKSAYTVNLINLGYLCLHSRWTNYGNIFE